MRLSTKLFLTITTGVAGLLFVSTFNYLQLERTHATTVAFADDYLPISALMGDIRTVAIKLKSTTLEMMAEHDDDDALAALDVEFQDTKTRLDTLVQSYRDGFASGPEDIKLIETVISTSAKASESLDLVNRVIHKHDRASAAGAWGPGSEAVENLLLAVNELDGYNARRASHGRTEADETYHDTIISSLIASGFAVMAMSCMALWSYLGLIGPIRALEVKLNYISLSLDLNERIDLGESEEMRKATEAINRLLERARGGMAAIQTKHDEATHQANHDNLTGLPTRNLAKEQFAVAIEDAKGAERKAGLMFIDLDGFKAVNDNHGHDAGDFVLKEVANRIRGLLRDGDTVARLGGDEFLVVLPRLRENSNAAIVAEKIISSIGDEIEYQGQSH